MPSEFDDAPDPLIDRVCETARERFCLLTMWGKLSLSLLRSLTTLASLATQNAATLLPLLQQGNHTVFAPSDSVSPPPTDGIDPHLPFSNLV